MQINNYCQKASNQCKCDRSNVKDVRLLKLEGITFEECSHQDAVSPTHPSAILLIYQNVTAVRRGWAVARDVREGNL